MIHDKCGTAIGKLRSCVEGNRRNFLGWCGRCKTVVHAGSEAITDEERKAAYHGMPMESFAALVRHQRAWRNG